MLENEDKLFWLSYIETKLGLVLPEIQQRRFESSIIKRMKALSLDSDGYFQKIKYDDAEWQSLVDDLIIPETSFFRHAASYDLIAHHLRSLNKPAYLWSVGCASGEEAWSLAMVAQETINEFRIMATDVSQTSIDNAEQGVYSLRKVHNISKQRLERHFELDGSGKYRVLDHLRENVSFYRHNLVDDKRLPFRELDVIFCQNVLIYFRSFVQRDVLAQLVRSLSKGGILVLAPGEARGWQHPKMERIQYKNAKKNDIHNALATKTLAFRKID